jgi:hypothetical protein
VGRFLKQVEVEAPVNRRVEDGVFIEVVESVVLEKCNQALWDLQKERVPSDGNGGRKHGRGEDRSLQRNDSGVTIPAVSLRQSSADVRTSSAAAAPLAPCRVSRKHGYGKRHSSSYYL